MEQGKEDKRREEVRERGREGQAERRGRNIKIRERKMSMRYKVRRKNEDNGEQTCHSIEMKNLDVTNKKSGSGGKNRDHGPNSNRLQKEITHPKRLLFVVSFF